MNYRYSSDNVERKGFISKDKILKYVSEKQIYELVFGFQPEEYQYVISPLRRDDYPGCWFENTPVVRKTGITDNLVFRDFAYRNRPLDCFDVIQDYYNLPNFYATLNFVYEKLIEGKQLNEQHFIKKSVKEDVEIFCESRNFIKQDKLFWTKYGISKQNLIDDRVFPVRRYVMTNTKSGTVNIRPRQLCYVFAEFEKRKKLYFPDAEKSKRFITNCKKDDIGALNTLPSFGRQLFITKSYKDCRVVRNQGRYSIWNQNEGMIPSIDLLISIIKRFKQVIVFYDNDEPGIKAAQELTSIINNHFPGKAAPLWLPTNLNQQGISDPADLIHYRSKNELNQFLNKI
jgi:5S rRNA maturation endonuclease (ribonuclease M5)